MKRSMQEIVELVVFGLIAVLVGTGVLWLVGWLIGLVGSLFMWIAGVLWLLLRYIIPVVVIIAAVYALFRLLQRQNQRRNDAPKREPVVSGPTGSNSGTTSATAGGTAPAAAPVTTPQVQGLPYNPQGPAAAVAPEATPSSTLGTREVKPLADDPVVASGEPVSDPLGASSTTVDERTVRESSEPIDIVTPEPVDPSADQNKKDS